MVRIIDTIRLEEAEGQDIARDNHHGKLYGIEFMPPLQLDRSPEKLRRALDENFNGLWVDEELY